MSGSLFERARDLFDKAEPLSAEERTKFLDQACRDDPELRSEVEALLETRGRMGGFLDSPASEWTGRKIGSCTIEGLISEGGMGVVLRATQDRPRRSVAVKLIRGRSLGSATRQRFMLETEALGRLDHPGIARIYEAGFESRDGRRIPYFVMELIEGMALTRHVEEKNLSARRRLELMATVCDAVHHAHLRGVIHRDLKPSNILVNADGMPKVLDFGIARITDSDLQLTTMHTDVGQVLGTLAYMSPEQVAGRHDQLDIRADVYALGVLLFEVLAGRLPQDLGGRDLLEAARIIAEQDPDTLGRAGRRFPDDLETIVAKCLRKDPARRYASAAELAADLRSFLNNEPIAARPATAAYQFRKFARRHRDAVVLASVALVILVAGLVVSLAGWTAARRAGEKATVAAAEARSMSRFLVDLLAAPDPFIEGSEVKVIDLLDRAAERAAASQAERPAVAVRLHQVLGDTYRGLGQYPQAVREWRLALQLAEQQAAGARDTNLVMPLLNLANLMMEIEDLATADTMFARLDQVLPGLPADSIHRFRAAQARGSRYDMQEEFDRAVAVLEPALDQARGVLGREHPIATDLQSALGNVLWQMDEPERARDLLEASLATLVRQEGAENPICMQIMNNLAMVHLQLGDLPRAREMLEQALAAKQTVMGPGHPSTAVGHHNLADTLRKLGDYEAAVTHHRMAIAIADTTSTTGDARVFIFQSGLGRTLMEMERYDEAGRVYASCYGPLAELYGADHPRVRAIAADLATIQDRSGDGTTGAR